MSDLIWIQQRTVTVSTSDFERCVTIAVEKIHGVSVDHAQSNAVNIALKVKLEKPIPFLSVNVQSRGDDTGEIMFTGRGARESDDERATIKPLLDSIADAIQKQCVNRKPPA